MTATQEFLNNPGDVVLYCQESTPNKLFWCKVKFDSGEIIVQPDNNNFVRVSHGLKVFNKLHVLKKAIVLRRVYELIEKKKKNAY